MNPEHALHEMARLLVQLHELIAADQTDSDDADTIRDRMDELSGFLEGSQFQMINDLSGDLYMLTGKEIVPDAMRELPPKAVHDQIEAAFGEKRWTDLLRALRGPHQLPKDSAAYARARAYAALGFHLAAVKFFEHAYALKPNPNYLALALDEHMESDMVDTAQALVQAIEDDRTAHPTLTLKAALVLLDLSRSRPEEEQVELDNRIGRLIERAKSDPRWPESVPSLRTAGLVALAFGLAQADQLTGAESSLDEAIGISPSSDAARVARGLVRVDAGRLDAAYEDFNEAVRLGTKTAWPYFYLTHRAVISADFRAAATLASVGAHLTPAGSMRAKFFEWWAIAFAEMGRASSEVLALFDAAEAENPFDAVIQANAAKYRSHISVLGAPATWQPSQLQSGGSVLKMYSRQSNHRTLMGLPAAAVQ
jgi:tetratricopeptide (TPR) repeat protein